MTPNKIKKLIMAKKLPTINQPIIKLLQLVLESKENHLLQHILILKNSCQ